MNQTRRWTVILYAPGETEVSLLAELAAQEEARLLAVIDPDGAAVGTAIAEVMGIRIATDWDGALMGQADWLVHPQAQSPPADLSVRAAAAGLHVVATDVFRAEYDEAAEPTPRSETAPDPTPEMESVHRTLSRIEEALDRDSLLRWLLSLATQAVGAHQGSIMLLDEKTDELYVAFSYGLSESTYHGTRVPVGQGIAGRVARSRNSEIILGREGDRDERDRVDIASAICAPLAVDGRLLGVLNVNRVDGDDPLSAVERDIVDRLASRMAVILDRLLAIQRSRATALFGQIDEQLQGLERDGDHLQTILSAWAGTLALGLEADTLSVAIGCADGGLLVAEGTRDGETRIAYGPLDNPVWREVFEQGRSVVVRQPERSESEDGGLTVFCLPAGRAPVRAVLTVVFSTAADAHAFNRISGEYLDLLEKRLLDLAEHITLKDRLARTNRLAELLGELVARREEDPLIALGRLRAGACALTGASKAYLVTACGPEGVELAAPDSVEDAPWLVEAPRLLAEAGQQGWRATLLTDPSTEDGDRICILAVPVSTGTTDAGLLLWQKERVHQLDGHRFTEFDAELCRRLTCLLPVYLREEPAADIAPGADSTPSATVPQVDLPMIEGDPILDAIRREMDRADRYHTTFALNAFRANQTTLWDDKTIRQLLASLHEQVRSSDRLFMMRDGTVLLLAPEDVQSLGKLHRRIVDELRQYAGGDYCEIMAAHTVYPGPQQDPGALLQDTLDQLSG